MTNETDYEEGEINDFSDDENFDSPQVVHKKEKISKKHKKRKREHNKHKKDDTKQFDPISDNKKAKIKPLDSKCGNLKSQKCKYFMEGRCQKGDECSFSHDFNPPKKPEVCRYYLNGNCGKGDQCIFYHEDFPCRYFHTSVCKNGDNCRFSHDPLTPLTKEMLDKSISESYAEEEGENNSNEIPPRKCDQDNRIMCDLPPVRPPMHPFGSINPFRPPPQGLWKPPQRLPFPHQVPQHNGHPSAHVNPRHIIPPMMRPQYPMERIPRMPQPPYPVVTDIDYRNKNMMLPPMARPRFPYNCPPINMAPRMPPVNIRPPNNKYLDDQIDKLAAFIVSKPPAANVDNNEEKTKETENAITNGESKHVLDPRLAKAQKETSIAKNEAKKEVYGGLLKREISWKVEELDLSDLVIFSCPNPHPNDPRSHKGINILAAATATIKQALSDSSETDTSFEKNKSLENATKEASISLTIVPKVTEIRTRPNRIKLNEMANLPACVIKEKTQNLQITATGDRSYLMDGRFKRRKIQTPSNETREFEKIEEKT